MESHTKGESGTDKDESNIDWGGRIKEFRDSPEYRELADYYGRKTLFDILGIARKEQYHSKMLKWLLDPKESHGLGLLPLQKFLKAIATAKSFFLRNLNSRLDPEMGKAFANESCKILDAIIKTEVVAGEKGRLDLFLDIDLAIGEQCKRLPVIVENKVCAKEGERQTTRYKEWAARFLDGNVYLQPVYVFLTPASQSELQKDTKNGCDCADFIRVNYQLLCEMVFDPCLKLIKDTAARSLVLDYIRCLSYGTIPFDEQNDDNNSTQGRIIMAIAPNEKKLLTDLFEKNRALFAAVVEALKDDPNTDDEEQVLPDLEDFIRKQGQRFRIVGGEGGLSRRNLVRTIVEKWVERRRSQGETVSFEDIANAFPADENRFGERGIVRPDNWDTFTKYPKKENAFERIHIQGIDPFRIRKRWGVDRHFDSFLHHARNLGFEIEQEK